MDLPSSLCSLDEDQGNSQHFSPHPLQAALFNLFSGGKKDHSQLGKVRHSQAQCWLGEPRSPAPLDCTTVSSAIVPGEWQPEKGRKLADLVNTGGGGNLQLSVKNPVVFQGLFYKTGVAEL